MSRGREGGALGAVEPVPVGRVDWRDERYRITAGEPGDELIEQVARWGCFAPPVVLPVAERWVPVAGFKRLGAVVELAGRREPGAAPGAGSEALWAHVLPEGLEALAVLAVAAREIRRDRPLTPFEVMRAIGRAQDAGAARAEVAERLLPELGLEPHATVVKRHRKLARVPAPLARWLESKGASLRRALRFVGRRPDEAALLVSLAEEWRLSLRALEECARMLGDVARRDGTSWDVVTDRAGLLGALRGGRGGAAGKQALQRLWELRYPAWARQRRLVEEAIAAVGAPGRVGFDWDETFERDGVELRVAVRTVDELRADLATLLEPDRLRRVDDLLESV